MRDELFRKPVRALTDFEFNEDVAAVFDDMLSRSIPFYDEVHRMIVDFVEAFYQPQSALIDLGCSTGATLAKIADDSQVDIHRFVGVDDSEPMLDRARQRFSDHPLASRIVWQNTDLRQVELEDPSVVIMNYTLQFVRPMYRQSVVNRIYQSLRPGGILIVSEKVLEQSTAISRLFIEMYWTFKRRQGYSDLEISRKREQLENVLVPYKVDEQLELLAQAGFGEAEIFFKWHNFASFIAIKDYTA